MNPFAAASIRKAERKLIAARSHSIEIAAGSVIHDCYYAMHHAARAVLHARSGDAPTKHAAVIAAFAGLSRELDGTGMLGRTLKQAFDARLKEDYDTAYTTAVDMARATLIGTESFVAACLEFLGVAGESE